MITDAIPQKEKLSFFTRTWRWLCTVDEAVHYDPVEKLHHRMDRLELKISKFEGNNRSGKSEEK